MSLICKKVLLHNSWRNSIRLLRLVLFKMIIFSHESNSTIKNVCLSVCNQNPSSSLKSIIHHLHLSSSPTSSLPSSPTFIITFTTTFKIISNAILTTILATIYKFYIFFLHKLLISFSAYFLLVLVQTVTMTWWWWVEDTMD